MSVKNHTQLQNIKNKNPKTYLTTPFCRNSEIVIKLIFTTYDGFVKIKCNVKVVMKPCDYEHVL